MSARADEVEQAVADAAWRVDCLSQRMDACEQKCRADGGFSSQEYQRLLRETGAASRAIPRGAGFGGIPSEDQRNDPKHQKLVQAYERANSAEKSYFKQYKKEIDLAARDPETRREWVRAHKG